MILDTVIWWTGAIVLGAGAALAASCVVAAVSIVTIYLATRHVRRLFNGVVNLRLIHQWIRAGKPIWTRADDTMNMQMRPQSDGAE